MRTLYSALVLFMTSLCSVHAGSTRNIPCTLRNLRLDVAVVFDFSRNMSSAAIEQTIDQISSIFSNVTMSEENRKVLMTKMKDSLEMTANSTMIQHTYFNKTDQFQLEISNKIHSKTSSLGITGGLKIASSDLQTLRAQRNLSNIPQFIMIYTSSDNANPISDAVILANILKQKGIAIIVIDNSEDEISSVLTDIASPGMIFKTLDNKFISKVQAALCSVNAYCPNGWTQVSDSYPNGLNKKGECVRISTSTACRHFASAECNSMGGHLVSIFDANKDKFVLALAQHVQNTSLPYYWIGLSLSGGEKQWEQMPGQEPIKMLSSDYGGWVPGYSKSSLTSSSPFALMTWGSNGNGWATTFPNNLYYECQRKTCDTDNYCY